MSRKAQKITSALLPFFVLLEIFSISCVARPTVPVRRE
jgi:hypothetical protein